MTTNDAGEVEVSLVVPTYGRAASVERLLVALTRQADAPSFETIVSIDGSEDGTREIVDAYAGHLPLRRTWQGNRGRGPACNTGAREARGRLLVLLDDDMEPAPHFLREHLRAHAGDTSRAVVGPVPISCHAASPPLVRYRARGFALKLEKLAKSGSEPPVFGLYTGNFSVSRGAFLELGGFDESFQGYGNEDYELLARLRRAGLRFHFAPRAEATQHYEKTYENLARDTRAEAGNAMRLAERHPDLLGALYLMELDRGGAARRAAIGLGCRLAERWPGLLSTLAALIHGAERRESPRISRYYDLALDLHYSLGVRAALRDRGREKPLSWPSWLRSVRALSASGTDASPERPVS